MTPRIKDASELGLKLTGRGLAFPHCNSSTPDRQTQDHSKLLLPMMSPSTWILSILIAPAFSWQGNIHIYALVQDNSPDAERVCY